MLDTQHQALQVEPTLELEPETTKPIPGDRSAQKGHIVAPSKWWPLLLPQTDQWEAKHLWGGLLIFSPLN
jgi:hypothetical protein